MTDLRVSFGPIVHAGMVRDALQATIALWSTTYLAELARGDEGTTGALPDFRSYVDSLDTSKFLEEQYPSCVLVVPGITSEPKRTGRGPYTAEWVVGVGCVVTASSRARSIRLAQLYTASTRALLVQNRSLGGFASGVQWAGERFVDSLSRDAARTIAAGMLQFLVQVDGVVDASQGPVTPITDGSAPTGWPVVDDPELSIAAYPIGGMP